MDVQVKLMLQGGHTWQVRCDEDDPLIFGLVSALPGASVDPNLPSDGLIQVETARGERLFLTRSSLVSVELRSLGDRAVDSAPRLARSAASLPNGVAGPASFVWDLNALPADLHASLAEQASANAGQDFRPLAALPNLNAEAIRRAMEARIGEVRSALGVPDLLETHLDLRFATVETRAALDIAPRPDDVLSLVYVAHGGGKPLGSGLRLFDRLHVDGLARAGAGFRDLPLEDNALLVYPSSATAAGLPLQFAAGTPGRIGVIRGALRRGLAGE